MARPRRAQPYRPGRDVHALRHPAATGLPTVDRSRSVVVVGGGIAGLAAATALAERGVEVTLVEREAQLGGRVRAWPLTTDSDGGQAGAGGRTMSRGFHAFFRQYYNLRRLLRRADPALSRLIPIDDYPLQLADGPADSFARLPRTPPWNLVGFVLGSPSFPLSALRTVNAPAALELVSASFPDSYPAYDGESAAAFLERLRFPDTARHLALEVFARSFFADPDDFSAGELVAMFHTYFTGSAEGLLFDVPDDDYDTALWAPLGRYLHTVGVRQLVGLQVTGVSLGPSIEVTTDAPGAAILNPDAVVLAVDPAGCRRLIGQAHGVDESWRAAVTGLRSAPPFGVLRLWLDRPVDAGRDPFLGTSGFGILDNVSVLNRFEAGAAHWAGRTGGSVVELHAYALPTDPDEPAVRRELRDQLARVYPETADAPVAAQEWLLRDDCWLIGTEPWRDRPGVVTPDPRLVLAGDGIRCGHPVALMERAATTGLEAANALLGRWGVAGHDLWTVPRTGLLGGRRAATRTKAARGP